MPSSPAHGAIPDFDAFYAREFAAIALVAGTTAGDRASGEDIAQEALTRAHRDWPRVGSLDKPGAWVRRVAINLALSRRRRLQRETRALSRVGATSTRNTDDRTHRNVWDAVAQLPPRQRAVTALFYHEGLSVNEIADVLDCSVSAATTNLNRARTRLATLLAPDTGASQ